MKNVSINKDVKLSQHLASPSEATLSHSNKLDGLRLSPHFTLGELTKTSYHPQDGNIPSHVAIKNLTRLCLWLEILRERYNQKYGDSTREGQSLCVTGDPRGDYLRVSERGGEQALWRGERLEPPDGLRGGYPLRWARADDPLRLYPVGHG